MSSIRKDHRDFFVDSRHSLPEMFRSETLVTLWLKAMNHRRGSIQGSWGLIICKGRKWRHHKGRKRMIQKRGCDCFSMFEWILPSTEGLASVDIKVPQYQCEHRYEWIVLKHVQSWTSRIHDLAMRPAFVLVCGVCTLREPTYVARVTTGVHHGWIMFAN